MRHLLAALLLLPAVPAPATTFAPAATADLVRAARRVCCATCESVEARLDRRSGIVFTHVRLQLLEDLKGAGASSVIELRLAGGAAEGVVTKVPGMPRFRAGEESVLLLGAVNRDGYPVVVQARRGVLPLRRDREGRRFVAARLTGFEELEGKDRVSVSDLRTAVRRVEREQQRKGR